MSDTPLYRLVNLHPATSSRSKVSAMISAEVYDYFFRHICAGEHGSIQEVISMLFQKLYEHCKDTLQIPAVWDPSSESILAKTLTTFTFNDNSELLTRIATLERELADARGAAGGRCSDPGAPLDQSKPAPSKRVRRTARTDSPESQNALSDSGKTKGSSNRGNRTKKENS